MGYAYLLNREMIFLRNFSSICFLPKFLLLYSFLVQLILYLLPFSLSLYFNQVLATRPFRERFISSEIMKDENLSKVRLPDFFALLSHCIQNVLTSSSYSLAFCTIYISNLLGFWYLIMVFFKHLMSTDQEFPVLKPQFLGIDLAVLESCISFQSTRTPSSIGRISSLIQ